MQAVILVGGVVESLRNIARPILFVMRIGMPAMVVIDVVDPISVLNLCLVARVAVTVAVPIRPTGEGFATRHLPSYVFVGRLFGVR